MEKPCKHDKNVIYLLYSCKDGVKVHVGNNQCNGI